MQKASCEPPTTGQVSQVDVFVAFLSFIRISSAAGRRDGASPTPCSVPKLALSSSFDLTSERRCAPCAISLSPSSRKGAGSIWLSLGVPGNPVEVGCTGKT